jgi:glycosyltransferase involved in cell wall biosynthesis
MQQCLKFAPGSRKIMAKQVLHILGTAQPEGAGVAHIVRILAEGLDPNSYRIHALFLAGAGPLVDLMQPVCASSGAIEWWRGMRDPMGALNFWRTLRRRRFDIVHLHSGGNSVSSLARAATGARIVRHIHGRVMELKELSPAIYSSRGVDAVIAVSQSVARRVVDGKARVIYAGIPTHLTRPGGDRPSTEIVLGTAGRLVEVKGIEYLLQAVSLLRREFPSVQLEIAGSGPLRETLEAEVVRSRLGQHVKFLGWIDDINSVLPRWSVFVMPSLDEGFPIAALDAMAAGVPVLATSVGGVPELIQDGTNGCLVPPRDVDALVSRLRVLLCDPALRNRIGLAGFAHARDHFGPDQMIASFAQLYDELLDTTASRSDRR